MYLCALMSFTNIRCFCLTEIEAKEACDWLRAAGFPQYAQLYQGNTPPSHQSPTALFRTEPAPPSEFFPLVFYIMCDSFSLPAIPQTSHPCLVCPGFYFQSSVPLQREGSWERPCYHCWDSHSSFLPVLKLTNHFFYLPLQQNLTFFYFSICVAFSVFHPVSCLLILSCKPAGICSCDDHQVL